jgi:large subunit ribosomal protein L18
MSVASKKLKTRMRIKARIRGKISGTAERPRLSVFRSNKQIYAQIVDDLSGKTLASASSRAIPEAQSVAKIDQAKLVGTKIAEAAKAAGIDNVVFDRNGYLYHGRVKNLADAAREGGLKF